MPKILVLSDGETFSQLNGCTVYEYDDETILTLDELESALDAHNGQVGNTSDGIKLLAIIGEDSY